MTFLEAVNRMLRLSTLMQWDDDDIASFSNTQHAGNIILCRQAIQHCINELTGTQPPILWPSDAEGEITAVTGTRTYSLAGDFVRLQTPTPYLFELTGASGSDATGTTVAEYPGGRRKLEVDIPAYTSQQGPPQWFYFTGDRTIGLYPVPDSGTNGTIYRYPYEKGVMVSSESDSLPFDSNNNDAKSIAFVDMASRAFGFLFSKQPLDGLPQDSIYKGAKSALLTMLRKRPASTRYGFRYASCE